MKRRVFLVECTELAEKLLYLQCRTRDNKKACSRAKTPSARREDSKQASDVIVMLSGMMGMQFPLNFTLTSVFFMMNNLISCHRRPSVAI